jgi:AraC-like DNA-binding protein
MEIPQTTLVTLLSRAMWEGTATRPTVQAHDAHELVYVVTGSYRARLHQVHWECVSGEVLCYPAGTRHAGDLSVEDRTVIYVVQWRPVPADAWPATPIRTVDSDGRLLTLLGWMGQLTPPGTRAEASRRDALLHVTLGEFRALQEAPPTLVGAVAQVRHAMEHNYQFRHIDLPYYANLVGLSTDQLHRRFKAEVGMPPMRYLRLVRLRAAMRLLRQTDRPLREVAAAAGFCDVAHLCHEITRACGRPPTALRADERQRNSQACPPTG